MRTNKGIYNWNALLILLYVVGMGVCLMGMPKYMDDLWYLNHLQDWFKMQGVDYPDAGGNIFKYGIPWEGILEIWKDHAGTDNIRLGNVVAPILLLFPKWLGSGLMVVMFFFSLYLLCRLLRINLQRSALVPIGIVLVALVLPWNELMGSLVYQINYMGTTFFAMLVTWLIFIGRRPIAVRYCIGALLLGFVAGWWHEGFGVPLSFGLATLAVMYRRFRRMDVYLAIAGLVAGVAVSLSCEGMHDRIGYMGGFIAGWFSNYLLINLYLPIFIFVSTLALTVYKRGWQRVIREPFWAFCISSGMASAFVMHYSLSFSRGGWWFWLMMICAILHSLQESFPKFWSHYSWKHILICSPFLLLVYVQLGFGGYYTLQFRQRLYDDFQEWKRNPHKTRFTDLSTLQDVPPICGYFPVGIMCARMYDQYASWQTKNWKSIFVLNDNAYNEPNGGIPEALRYVTPESGYLLPGDANLRMKDGYLFKLEDEDMTRELKADDTSNREVELDLDFGKGYIPVRQWQLSFVSEADGRRYIFVRITLSWYMTHFKPIKGARNLRKREIKS